MTRPQENSTKENFAVTLVDALRKHGSDSSLIFLRKGQTETVLSFAQIQADTLISARTFQARGLANGDRAIIFLDKCPAWIIAHLAIQRLGAVSVPLNPEFKTREMEYYLARTSPVLVIAGPDQAEIIRQIDPNVKLHVIDPDEPYCSPEPGDKSPDLNDLPNIRSFSPNDPGLIIFTSGTTGDPKGAVLTSANMAHDAHNIVRIWEISADDTLCHTLPLYHTHGLGFALHTSLFSGANIIMLDAFEPETVIKTLSGEKEGNSPTVLMAVPTMYHRLLSFLEDESRSQGQYDLSGLRLITSGSAPLLPEDFDRITKAFGQEPVEREGMSETGMNFSNPVHGHRTPGSIGLPLPQLEVMIVNPETLSGRPEGETGEIWLKGPGITPGYWEMPEETEKAFKDDWFRTGDLGRVDEEGYYYLTDRIKHIIISGGENISPMEIEGIISSMPGVAESCVVGLPDPDWGERVVAAVVLTAGSRSTPDSETSVSPIKIKAYVKDRLSGWKCPKAFLLVEKLPRNAMGKVLTDSVKDLFGSS